MIVYYPEPLELLTNSSSENMIELKLPSGGLVQAEPWGHGQARILRIVSTDPMDYMESRLQPGSLLDLTPNIK